MSAEEMGEWWFAKIPRMKRLGPCRKGEGLKDTSRPTNYAFQLDQAPNARAPPAI